MYIVLPGRDGHFCLLSKFFSNISADGHRIFSAVMQDGTKPDYLLDGMTNDRDGNLYVAAFNGSQIVKLNPRYIVVGAMGESFSCQNDLLI